MNHEYDPGMAKCGSWGRLWPLTNFWWCMTLHNILATSTWNAYTVFNSMIMYGYVQATSNGATIVNSWKWCISFKTACLTVWFLIQVYVKLEIQSFSVHFSVDIVYLTAPQILINVATVRWITAHINIASYHTILCTENCPDLCYNNYWDVGPWPSVPWPPLWPECTHTFWPTSAGFFSLL